MTACSLTSTIILYEGIEENYFYSTFDFIGDFACVGWAQSYSDLSKFASLLWYRVACACYNILYYFLKHMGFGSFYTGENKKKKKGGSSKPISVAPVFTPPAVVPKGKNR